jgi:hypothetical protein
MWPICCRVVFIPFTVVDDQRPGKGKKVPPAKQESLQHMSLHNKKLAMPW